MQPLGERRTRKSMELGGLPCGYCGREDALLDGAHPLPDLSDWCLETGQVTPPHPCAAEWYGGPLPDTASLDARWEHAANWNRVDPDEEPALPLPPEGVRAIQANPAYFF